MFPNFLEFICNLLFIISSSTYTFLPLTFLISYFSLISFPLLLTFLSFPFDIFSEKYSILSIARSIIANVAFLCASHYNITLNIRTKSLIIIRTCSTAICSEKISSFTIASSKPIIH